jgi:cyclopropane-fatty-acyl-phospholipid synthase
MTGTRQLHDFLAQSLAAFPWPIVISDPDDRSYRVGGTREHWCGQPLTIRFKIPRAVDDVLSLNGRGLLERFVWGEVDMTGNLYALPFLKHYLNLNLSYPRLLVALFRNGLGQTVERARVNVSSHYDIPQPVLDLYLDRTYMSYSCGMFEDPSDLDTTAMRTPGKGEHDTFDSLEKAQWRKFKDAVDFIDPAPGETLLDVGCGYGGQLIVALDSHPFGKVVGCTHSHKQAAVGRQWLSGFDTARRELLEADYRTDPRVFDHVTSTGMISHVGPRGLAPYCR